MTCMTPVSDRNTVDWSLSGSRVQVENCLCIKTGRATSSAISLDLKNEHISKYGPKKVLKPDNWLFMKITLEILNQ